MAAVGLVVSYIDMDMETKLAITGLVFLLMVQLQFIISRAHKKGEEPRKRETGKRLSPLKKKPSAKAQTASRDQAIDPTVFSLFQKNLTQSSEPELENPEDDVILSLSSKGKSKNREKTVKKAKGPTSHEKTVQPPKAKTGPLTIKEKETETPGNKLQDKIPVASIGRIFDDIKETPEVTSGNVDPVKLPPKKLDKLILPTDSSKKNPETTQAMDPPLASKEILTSSDFEADASDARDEAELTLSVAQSFYQKKEYEKSLSALKPLFDASFQQQVPSDVMVKLTQLKGDCEFDLEQYEKASKTLQELFITHVDKQHPQYLEILEQIVKKYVDADQQHYAVHFLFTALNEFRQLHEFDKMDTIYAQIELAYHQLEDWPRLTQTYQNHLAIKKTLKDFKGQLGILDYLGKLLYDQGDDEGSRKCYEQRLTIESQMEKS